MKLAAIRRTAPEVLLTAKTQRWTPEEVLRTLVETELAARDASNIRTRLKAAGFPVAKTLDTFDVTASFASISRVAKIPPSRSCGPANASMRSSKPEPTRLPWRFPRNLISSAP